jgi:hydroxyethylthiazole kinase-like sugar kinase family protein
MMSMIAARDLVGMIEAHAVQHAGAAVVAGGEEFLVAERGHDLDLVLRHGAERIAGMIVAAGRLFGIAIAAQVGANDGEFLAPACGATFCPVHMVERIAVHQQ